MNTEKCLWGEQTQKKNLAIYENESTSLLPWPDISNHDEEETRKPPWRCKLLVLQTGQPKTIKNQWFYYKTGPGHGQRATEQRIRGLHFTYSPWRNYEEPLPAKLFKKKRKVDKDIDIYKPTFLQGMGKDENAASRVRC